MNRLVKAEGQAMAASQVTSPRRVKAEAQEMPPQEREEGIPRKDNVEWSSEMKEEDWDRLVSDVIDKIKKQYPGIDIVVADQNDGSSLSSKAALLGKGKHIVISKAFMERIKSSREEFGKCCAAISEAAKQLAGQKGGNYSDGVFLGRDKASFWSVSVKENREQKNETLFSMMKKQEEESNTWEQDFRMTAMANVSTSGNYSKVAGAKTKGQVQQAIGDVHRDIGNLKIVSCFGTPEQQVKARRAIRSLEKLLHRGSRKIQRLNREQLKQYAEKRAHKEMKRRKEEQIRLELKKMQTARKSADHALVKEGQADDAYIRGYRQYKRVSELYQQEMRADILADISGDMGVTPVGDMMGGGNSMPGEFSMSDGFSF